MSSQKSLISINLQGKDVFLFSEYEPEKNLTLKILDIKDNESYIGKGSALFLRTQAARIRITFRDYIDHAMRALFQSDQEEFNYVYSLEEKEKFVFMWKNVAQDETVITLGLINMIKQDYITVFAESLLSLAEEIQALNSTVQKLSSDLEESKNQTTNAFHLLSEAIDAKEEFEEEMYSKFSVILNAKKKALQRRRNEKIIASERFTRLSNLNDSSEEDEEEVVDPNQPGPSTSVKRNALFDDDDDDECVVPLKPSKMRNRNNANERKSNPPEEISDHTNYTRPDLFDDDDDSDDLLSNL